MDENASRTMERERGMLGLIGRAIGIVFAFGLSALLTLVVLLAVGSYQTAQQLDQGPPIDPQLDEILRYVDLFFGGASFVVAVAPILTLLPALLIVIIGEVARIRSALFYVAGGGLAAVALPVLASTAGTSFNPQMLAVFATAGFAGGLCYWLLAGRRA